CCAICTAARPATTTAAATTRPRERPGEVVTAQRASASAPTTPASASASVITGIIRNGRSVLPVRERSPDSRYQPNTAATSSPRHRASTVCTAGGGRGQGDGAAPPAPPFPTVPPASTAPPFPTVPPASTAPPSLTAPTASSSSPSPFSSSGIARPPAATPIPNPIPSREPSAPMTPAPPAPTPAATTPP